MLPPQIRTLIEYLKEAELCLAISAALVLFVGLAGIASGNLESTSNLVLGTLMMLSALIARGYLSLRWIDEILPVLPVAGISGILLLTGSIISLVARGSLWTNWTILIAAIFALYATLARLRRPPPIV